MSAFPRLLLALLLLFLLALTTNGEEYTADPGAKQELSEAEQQPGPGIRAAGFTIDDLLEGNVLSGQTLQTSDGSSDKSVQKSKDRKL